MKPTRAQYTEHLLLVNLQITVKVFTSAMTEVYGVSEHKIGSADIHQPKPADFETAIAQTGYGKFNYLLTLSALPAVLSSVFVSTTVSYVLPAAQCDLQLSNFDKGTLNAVTYAGMISSAFLWGFLSDNFGRQRLLVIGYFLDGMLSLSSSLAQTLWYLQLLRFLVGFIGCGPFAILMTYLAECHASQYRSRILMTSGVFASLAFISVPVIALMVLPQSWSWQLFGSSVTYKSWNLFLAICALPGILTGLLMKAFPESPKFLMSRGQREEALNVFRHIYYVNTGKHPDTFPVKELVDELSLNTVHPISVNVSSKGVCSALTAGCQQMRPLFGKAHLTKAMLMFSIQMGALFGMNTLRLWMPQLLSTMQEYMGSIAVDSGAGADVQDGVSLCQMLMQNMTVDIVAPCAVYVSDFQIYVNSIIIGATCGAFSVGAGFVINAVGKNKLMVICFFAGGVCGMSVYWSRSPSFTLALFALYQAVLEVSATCTIGVVVDIFPTTLRTMAVSLTMMFGRMGSLLGNLVFPVMLDLRCEVPFFVVSGVIFGCSAVSLLLPAPHHTMLQ